MEAILSYTAKLFLCSALFFFYYRLFLYNRSFHAWNRFYLISSLFLSVLIPLIEIPVTKIETPELVGQAMTALSWNRIDTQLRMKETYSLPLICLISISLLLVIRIIYGSLRLYFVYRKSEVHALQPGVKFVLTRLQHAPFSFFSWLFWREDIDPNSDCGKRILRHELTHINQKHSIDKIFTELAIAVFWINPFFWLIRKELYLIHEFIADRKAVEGNDGAAFAAMILRTLNLQPIAERGITSAFSASPVKRRLFMITKGGSLKKNYLRRLGGLAFMGLSFCAISLNFDLSVGMMEIPSETRLAKTLFKAAPQLSEEEQLTHPAALEIALTTSQEMYLPPARKEKVLFNQSTQSASVPGKKSRKKSSKIQLTGDRGDQTALDYEEKIVSGNPGTEKKAALQSRSVNSSLNEDSQNSGAIVVQGRKMISGSGNGQEQQNHDLPRIRLKGSVAEGSGPLYLLDGEELAAAEMVKIDPQSIYSIAVYKGDEAIERFGSRAKDGAIWISLHK